MGATRRVGERTPESASVRFWTPARKVMLGKFRKFALHGDAFDLAVIIGAAFDAIVDPVPRLMAH
jgi:hypothetical protein